MSTLLAAAAAAAAVEYTAQLFMQLGNRSVTAAAYVLLTGRELMSDDELDFT